MDMMFGVQVLDFIEEVLIIQVEKVEQEDY